MVGIRFTLEQQEVLKVDTIVYISLQQYKTTMDIKKDDSDRISKSSSQYCIASFLVLYFMGYIFFILYIITKNNLDKLHQIFSSLKYLISFLDFQLFIVPLPISKDRLRIIVKSNKAI